MNLSKEEQEYLREVVARELSRARGGHVIGEQVAETAAVENAEHFLEALLRKLGGKPAEGHVRPAKAKGS
jgi:hypothetical protein